MILGRRVAILNKKTNAFLGISSQEQNRVLVQVINLNPINNPYVNWKI